MLKLLGNWVEVKFEIEVNRTGVSMRNFYENKFNYFLQNVSKLQIRKLVFNKLLTSKSK
jgi:hypothetical protein